MFDMSKIKAAVILIIILVSVSYLYTQSQTGSSVFVSFKNVLRTNQTVDGVWTFADSTQFNEDITMDDGKHLYGTGRLAYATIYSSDSVGTTVTVARTYYPLQNTLVLDTYSNEFVLQTDSLIWTGSKAGDSLDVILTATMSAQTSINNDEVFIKFFRNGLSVNSVVSGITMKAKNTAATLALTNHFVVQTGEVIQLKITSIQTGAVVLVKNVAFSVQEVGRWRR